MRGLYDLLDEHRARTSLHLSSVYGSSTAGTHQWRTERDALARSFEERLAGMSIGDLPLCFGRLDMAGGGRFHIGRLALSDEHHEPLLVDWRAPAAQPFYQATAGDPQGVVRRRHLLTRGREVISLDDEVFDLESLSERDRAGLQGDAALLAALSRERTGRMGDIVATIQADQDRIIRSELAGALVVQGGPGTGKTVVALHRAAYLLYTHRRQLAGSGVLIVGPNGVFLRYIEQVLPSLGETGALLLTPGELFPGVTARRSDPPDVARVKGDLRMVDVLRKAVADRQRVPRQDLTVNFEGERLRLDRRTLRSIRSAARRSRRPHNRGREVVERLVLDALAAQLEEPSRRADLRRTRAFREAMERLWPLLSPQELLNDLFGFPALLRSAAPDLSAAEREALARPRRPSAADVDWSAQDVALLDEAAEILGTPATGRRRRGRGAQEAYARRVLAGLDLGFPVDAEAMAARYAGERGPEPLTERARADGTWAFGHVIVDEAQELSAMEWRVLFRRCPSRSMTIVGDLAQAGVAWRPSSWAEVLDLHARGRWRVAELTVNYRTPREIMDVAAAVLARSDPGVVPPVAMRDAGETPWVERVQTLDGQLVDAVRRELDMIGTGRLAVLTPAARRDEVESAVRGALPEAVTGSVLDSPVAVLAVKEAKGLEFDAVVLVEPGEIVRESERGLSDLYVALTRATRRLGVLYTQLLPPELAALPGNGPGQPSGQ
ncbi:MAG: HelD family protein [Acidimicrobiia bacterium]